MSNTMESSQMRMACAAAFLALLALWACRESREERPAQVPADSVLVVFRLGEAPAPVFRPVTNSSPDLRAALEWLFRGPTAEEQAAGIGSWFSSETAAALISVEVDQTGHATVDFQDLRPLIPNASSSAGSAMLLQELNGTAFQFPEIRSVEYRINGSCDLFWNWLQDACQIVQRPGRRNPPA